MEVCLHPCLLLLRIQDWTPLYKQACNHLQLPCIAAVCCAAYWASIRPRADRCLEVLGSIEKWWNGLEALKLLEVLKVLEGLEVLTLLEVFGSVASIEIVGSAEKSWKRLEVLKLLKVLKSVGNIESVWKCWQYIGSVRIVWKTDLINACVPSQGSPHVDISQHCVMEGGGKREHAATLQQCLHVCINEGLYFVPLTV